MPNFLMPEITTEVGVGKAILDEIGIGIAADNTLYDQESMAPIQFQGKNIKYSSSDPSSVYLGEGDVLFDPIHNLRMITTMLGTYINREEAENGREVLSMYDDFIRENKTTSHAIKFADGQVVSSKFYKNKCLAICDNILEMANANCDLTQFDDQEDKR